MVWALSKICDGVQLAGVGVLRGLFDNRYLTVVSLVTYWLVSLPLGYDFGFCGWAGVQRESAQATESVSPLRACF